MAALGYDPSVADVTSDSSLDRAEKFLDNAIAAQKAANNDLKGISENSVFTNAIHNLPNPQKSWLYEVDFKGDVENVKIGSDEYPIMKMTMPKVENKTVERWFKGTKRTYIINQDRSGTTDIEIQLRSDMTYNAALISKIIGAEVDLNNFRHTEFATAKQWSQIDISLCADVSGETTGIITLYNPIITNVAFTDLSYSSSDCITMSITIHYDWWNNMESH